MFWGETVLPRFKHTSVFRCLFLEQHCQTPLCCRVSGPFPDDLKPAELHQLLTLSLTSKSPQLNSGGMSCGCPGEGPGTAHTQDWGGDPRCESGCTPFVRLLCSLTSGSDVGTSWSCRMWPVQLDIFGLQPSLGVSYGSEVLPLSVRPSVHPGSPRLTPMTVCKSFNPC